MISSDFFLAGWRVRSEFRLPDLLPWAGGPQKLVDITITAGKLFEPLTDCVFESPLIRIARDHSCWFTVPGIARFFVNHDATEIRVDANGSDPGETAAGLFLLSTVLALVCHNRGLIPMHASCVDVGGRAVMFTGPSCAGKSLLAAAFWKAGYAVLSDDVTVLNPAAPTGAFALPSFPCLRLWRGALEPFELKPERLQRSRPELEKYNVSTQNTFVPEPRPLKAIYHLRRRRKAIAEATAPLHGARVLRDAMQAVYCAQTVGTFSPDGVFTQGIAAVCAGASSHILYCEPGFDNVAATVAAISKEHTD